MIIKKGCSQYTAPKKLDTFWGQCIGAHPFSYNCYLGRVSACIYNSVNGSDSQFLIRLMLFIIQLML